jgi:hypothetical protein
MANVFYKMGKYFALNPFMGLIICLSISAIFSLGMYNMRLETDPQSTPLHIMMNIKNCGCQSRVVPTKRRWNSGKTSGLSTGQTSSSFFQSPMMARIFSINHLSRLVAKFSDLSKVVYFLQNIMNGRTI